MQTPSPQAASRVSGPKEGYNPAIDSLKGGLILLVIVGHLFTASVNGNAVKWGIYSFHMPLFLGLGGYLLTSASLQRETFRSLISKYDTRLLLPWFLAFVAYVLLTGLKTGLSMAMLGEMLLKPPYHTWYVPVFFAFVVLAWLLRRVNPAIFLAIALVLGAFGMVAFGLSHHVGPLDRYSLPDQRYLTMMPFFAFGYWLRQSGRRFSPLWVAILILAGFAGFQACYAHPAGMAEIIPYAILNLALIAGLPILLSTRIPVPLADSIGYDSLYFYLWHPFLIAGAKELIYKRAGELPGAIIAFVLTLTVMFAARVILREWSWTRLLSGARTSRKAV